MIRAVRLAGTLLGCAAVSISLLALPAAAQKTKTFSSDPAGCKSCLSQAANLFASNQLSQALELLSVWSDKCPRTAQLHLLYSTILVRAGKNLDEAERQALLAVAASPDSQAARLQCAMTLMSNQKYRQAVHEFEALTDLNPASFEGWSALADLYKRLHQDEDAATAARKAANLEPSARAVRLAVLNNLKRSGNYARAKQELHRLVSQGDFGPEFDQSLAEEALQIGAYQDAIEAAERAGKTYPKSPQPLRTMALAQYLSGRYEHSEQSSSKWLAVAANNPEALSVKALSLLALGKNKQALEVAAQSESSEAASGLALVASGAAALANGHYGKAIELWGVCASTGPKSSAADRLPEALAHLNLYRLYLKQGALEEAGEQARSIGIDPRYKASALAAQAVCLLEGGSPETLAQAERLVKQAIDMGESSAEVLVAQAYSQLAATNFAKAQTLAEQAAGQEPFSTDAIVLLAKIAEAQAQVEQEDKLLQKGLEIAAADPGLLCLKGRLLLQNNNSDEAISLLTPLTGDFAAPEALFIVAGAWERKGAKQQALRFYKQSLEGLSGKRASLAKAAVSRLESTSK